MEAYLSGPKAQITKLSELLVVASLQCVAPRTGTFLQMKSLCAGAGEFLQ